MREAASCVFHGTGICRGLFSSYKGVSKAGSVQDDLLGCRRRVFLLPLNLYSVYFTFTSSFFNF